LFVVAAVIVDNFVVAVVVVNLIKLESNK